MATRMSAPPREPRKPASLIRTSYQVGRPWMFEGKMLRGVAGMPMRSTDFANNVFALAEPDPLTLANLTTKSLTRSRRAKPSVVVTLPVAVTLVVDCNLHAPRARYRE